MVRAKTRLAAAFLTVAFSGLALGQPAAVPVIAPPAPPTLWSFLGIPQGVKKVQGALLNRRGNLPRTEPKDAIKALNDPANLISDVPAIKRAAEIKKAEDLKPQKVKAIKYLTSIGCGCYDKDGSVTDALIATAEDCNETVRLTTMEEITAAANGKCCSNCGQVCCCNDKMLKKLAQVAYERDEFGCYTEPSKRVRDAAAAALAACCPGSPPLEILSTPEPAEDPEQELVPVPERESLDVQPVPERELNGEPERLPGFPEPTEGARAKDMLEVSPSDRSNDVTNRFLQQHQLRQTSAGIRPTMRSSTAQQSSVPAGIARMRRLVAASPPLTSATPNPRGGIVMAFDEERATAYVHFEKHAQVVPVGTTLHLRPDPRVASGFNGMWRVVESTAGCANLQPVGSEGVQKVRVGDQVNFGTPPVRIAPISFVR